MIIHYSSLNNSVDEMNMTALHVLSCNHNATLEMIRLLVSKCPDVALVKTKNGSFAVELLLPTNEKYCSRKI